MTLALYGKSRRRQWMLAALALFALLGAVSAAFAVLVPTNAASVTPQLTPDPANYTGADAATWKNPTCTDLDDHFGNGQTWSQVSTGSWYDPSTATFPITLNVDATHWVKITGIVAGNPMTFDWESNFGIDAVMVKQANGPHNIYVYDPPGPESFGDTGLQPNLNPNGISHAIFCYDGFTTPPPTANLIIGKVIDPSDGVAPDDGTTFSGTIVNDDTQASTPWSGITFGQFTSPIQVPAGVDLTIDEDSPTNGWTEVAWRMGSLDGEKPTCPADKASYVPGSNIGAKLNADQTMVLCVMNTKQADAPTRTLEVCKVVETDSAAGGVFTIKVEGQSDFVTTNIAPGGDDCTTYSVADGAEITITETGFPDGWVSAEFYPTVSANGDNIPGDTITVTVGAETCDAGEEQNPAGAQISGLHSDAIADCTVVFYNKTDGQTESRGLILVEKYIEIDGNLGTTLPGEGLVAGWTVTVDGVSKQTTLPATVTFEATVGDTVPVSETTQAGYVVLGHTITGGSLVGGSSTNVQVSEATTLVRFYNQPFGSLKVHKDAVTSHNGGPNVPAPQDDDGWSITVSSATCNFTDTKQTDASGNASFTNLPMCTDYVVSENPVNAASPGFAPISATSVSNQTPSGQTITFVNRRVTFDPPCQDCIQIIPTPTPTTVPPTATPTNTAVPPTATPTPEEATEGEKTPGPTPIAPSTGTGGSGGSGSMNILLLALGLAALSGGMSLAAAGRRRRN
ncbi:MAG: hypothetical protein FIB00_09875 [Chloroflexi bacterium]|nr:hypothetical protein [Chloroflexota bacterium]PWB46542.1 MAG: hypothetical protein C3F10_04895 [Dehalococcoidia bacterium]